CKWKKIACQEKCVGCVICNKRVTNQIFQRMFCRKYPVNSAVCTVIFRYIYTNSPVMVQQVTEGVSVTVETFYQPAQSNPLSSEFLFAYRITIENLSTVPVKLLRRHWTILDSNGAVREVEG